MSSPLKERMKIPRQHMLEQCAEERATEFHRSEPGLFRGTGAAGSAALPGVRQAGLYEGLSGGREGEGFRGIDCGRRLPGRGREDSRRQRAAGHHGARVPAGRSLRRRLLDGQESSAAGHRISGALCRGLRTASSGYQQPAQSGANGQESCDRGQRAFWSDRGGRSGAEGTSRCTCSRRCTRPGGVLVYGIPEFRLPKQIIREQIDYMRAMGVEFETDVVVGRTVTIDE